MDISTFVTQCLRSYIVDNLHTCLPGIVKKYDSATRKADILPAIKKKYYDGEELQLPIITDVPVAYPTAVDVGMQFNLSVGDNVLIIFSERSIGAWLYSDGSEDVFADSSRKFDLSDAIAIPGLMPFPTTSYAQEGELVLKNKTSIMKLKSDGKIAIGSGANELLDLVTQVIDALLTAIVPTGIGPQQLSTVTDGTVLIIKNKLAQIKGVL